MREQVIPVKDKREEAGLGRESVRITKSQRTQEGALEPRLPI